MRVRWLVVCPEGTRMLYGETKKLRHKWRFIGQRNSYRPVLPVAHNAGYFWGRRSLVKRARQDYVLCWQAKSTTKGA